MSWEPRIAEFLERYPLELSKEELAEVHAAAASDPELDAQLSGMAEVEDALDAQHIPFSVQGRERMDALVDAALDARGWSTDPATPSAHDSAPPAGEGSNIIELARRRRRDGPLLVVVAAVLGLGTLLTLQMGPAEPEFGARGEVEELAGILWVMGDARVQNGDARDVGETVTFRAVLEGASTALVLLETQGESTHVIWPPPGDQWLGEPGPNPVGGSSPARYRPRRPGRAEYHLVAISSAPEIHAGAVPLDETVGKWGGRVLDRIAIEWR